MLGEQHVCCAETVASLPRVSSCSCARPHTRVYRAAAATSISEQHEAAQKAGLSRVEQGPEVAVTDNVASASVQQLRQEILRIIQELAGQPC